MDSSLVLRYFSYKILIFLYIEFKIFIIPIFKYEN